MAKQFFSLTDSGVEVLRKVCNGDYPKRLGPGHPDLSVCVALVESGHLDGWVIVEETMVCAVLDLKMTPLGEDVLDREGFFMDRRLHLYRRPTWLAAGMALGFGLLVLLATAGPARKEDATVLTSETPSSSVPLSSPKIFGVCGLGPIE